MPNLTIIAHITAHSNKTELVKSELVKMIEPTLAEAGCVNYDLHQDNDDPAHFMFYENWETRDLWLAHMNAPHLAAFKKAVDGAIKTTNVIEMSAVN